MKRVYLLLILTTVFIKSYSNIDGQNKGNYYMNMQGNENNFTGQNGDQNKSNSNATPNAGQSNGNKLPQYFLELSDKEKEEVLSQYYNKEDLKKMLFCIRFREQKGCFWDYIKILLCYIHMIYDINLLFWNSHKLKNFFSKNKLEDIIYLLIFIINYILLYYFNSSLASKINKNTAYENQAKYRIYKNRMKVNINA